MFGLPPLPRTLAACERDIASPSVAVRVSVAGDLAKGPLHDQDFGLRCALLERCLEDAEANVRRQALLSIADLKAHVLLDRVCSMLGDPELEVRQLAVLALGEIAEPDDEAAVGRVASLLRAGAAPIRYQALIAYAGLRPELCASDLETALSDSDVEIQKLAVRLLDEVLLARGVPIPPTLCEKLVERAQARDPGLSLLAQMVGSELGLPVGHARILEVVDRRLKVSEPRDEQWAIDLCGRLKLKAALRSLRRRAFGWFGRSADPFVDVALAALAKMGDDRALSVLLRQLRAQSYVQRVQAVEALGASGQRMAQAALMSHREQLRARSSGQEEEFELVNTALLTLDREL